MGSSVSERCLASFDRICAGATLLRATGCGGARPLHHAIGVCEVSFPEVILCRLKPHTTASRYSNESGSRVGKCDARGFATAGARDFIAGTLDRTVLRVTAGVTERLTTRDHGAVSDDEQTATLTVFAFP